MNRIEWQQLAERWLLDANALLAARRWSAAYYVAGYAVECGLKACVLAHITAVPEVIFDDRRFSERCWTHNLLDLVKVANLEAIWAAEVKANKILGDNWMVVKDWNERARYKSVPYHKAKKLYAAISDSSNGVMPWIRLRW